MGASHRILVHVVIAILLVFGMTALTLADTTSTLRPTADGGNDSTDWKHTGGNGCGDGGTSCYTEVDESTCDDSSTYIESSVSGANQTFDIDESSITDNSTITQIDVTLCYAKGESGAANAIQARHCVGSSCSNSGSNLLPGTGYGSSTQSFTGLAIIKTASTDIEIGVALTGTAAKKTRVSQVAAVITYTPPDTTAPAAVNNLAAGTPTTTSMPLTWTSPGDDGSTGTAASYDMRHSTSTITSGNFSSATTATGEPAPSVAGRVEAMTISNLAVNTQYYFALKSNDEVPNTSDISNVASKYTLAHTPVAAAFGDVTTTSIDTNWTANGNPAGTEYFVENQTAGTSSGWITATTWTSSSLSAGTAYTFRVKARNGDTTETAWVSLGSQSTSSAAATPPPTYSQSHTISLTQPITNHCSETIANFRSWHSWSDRSHHCCTDSCPRARGSPHRRTRYNRH